MERGRGIGSLLGWRVLQELKGLGIERVSPEASLWCFTHLPGYSSKGACTDCYALVGASNNPAMKFFEKLGFAKNRRKKSGLKEAPHWVLHKKLHCKTRHRIATGS